jgi:hypothetical protein
MDPARAYREVKESRTLVTTPGRYLMDAKQVAAAESLYRTATRLQRLGLIIDRNSLSPAQRRAAFALQCLTANCPEEEESEPQRSLIGFAYPNAR